MTALAEKIYNEVLDLPTDERLSLLDKLLHVITIPAPADIEAAWLKESHKRLADIRSGQSQTVPGEAVLKKINARLAR